MMHISELQRQLQSIYAIHTGQDIADYMTSDQKVLQQFHPGGRIKSEALLISGDSEELALSLYLSEEIVQQLHVLTPENLMSANQLEILCTAVEGISHFQYLVWRAQQGQSVTQLELEMQAEVDKYIVCAAILAQHYQGDIPTELHARLFEQCYFESSLNAEEQLRYWLANHYAKIYCRHLHTYLLDYRHGYQVTRAVRQFYRLPYLQKLRHIHVPLN